MAGGICGIYRSPEPLCINSRKITWVIYMCMCQKNKFYLSQSHWYFCIFIIIRSLLHSAVYKKLVTCCLKIITGSRNLMSCPDKCNLHIKTSLQILISPIVLLHFACLTRQLFTAFMILLYCINYTLQWNKLTISFLKTKSRNSFFSTVPAFLCICHVRILKICRYFNDSLSVSA